MSDMMDRKSKLPSSISELESLGLETRQLNELNDSYEVENLVENLSRCSSRTTNLCLYLLIDTRQLTFSFVQMLIKTIDMR